MEWILIAVAAAGGAGWAGRRWQLHRSRAADAATDLAMVRRLAEEDVTVFGDQLRRLDAEVADQPLDGDALHDYRTAIDAFESASRTAPRIASTDQISAVIDTLSDGRYALACVQARVEGRPVPERRVPCFFNPQHGPSTTEVMWTAGRGGGTRRVPACAQDAARVAAHEEPEVRMVTIGQRRVPYWEAGAALEPYGLGHFAGSPFAGYLFHHQVNVGNNGGISGFEGGWGGGGDTGFGGGGSDGGGGGFDGGGGNP